MFDLLKMLDIQDLDMKMIRLMRLKRARQDELAKIHAIKNDLDKQVVMKEGEIIEIKKNIRLAEMEVQEIEERIVSLEERQSAVKKVEEFNALNQEISAAEREKALKEQRHSDLIDKLASADDVMSELRDSQNQTLESSKVLEEEINESISLINQEGRELKDQRDALADKADSQVLEIYERLLKNKKDRVVVPIENRVCSGCHIQLTAQHENLVRKQERLVFCEHCSRILYWQDAQAPVETEAKPRRRRRTAQAS